MLLLLLVVTALYFQVKKRVEHKLLISIISFAIIIRYINNGKMFSNFFVFIIPLINIVLMFINDDEIFNYFTTLFFILNYLYEFIYFFEKSQNTNFLKKMSGTNRHSQLYFTTLK